MAVESRQQLNGAGSSGYCGKTTGTQEKWLHPKRWKLLFRNLARDLSIKSEAIKILLEEIQICTKSYFPRKETFQRKLELYS